MALPADSALPSVFQQKLLVHSRCQFANLRHKGVVGVSPWQDGFKGRLVPLSVLEVDLDAVVFHLGDQPKVGPVVDQVWSLTQLYSVDF